MATQFSVSPHEMAVLHHPEMSESAPTIERAYRVRLRPTPAQARVLTRLFGARRFVWNWALRRKDEAWRADGTKLSGIDLSREFTQLRATSETAWLSQLPREPFNQTLRDFDTAWRNFFAGRAKRPRRRKFGTVQSARFTLDQRREQVNLETGRVKLDRIGTLRFRVSEPMTGRLRSVTFSRDSAGRWFACFTADGVACPESTPAVREAIGMDLGLRDTAVMSDGQKTAAPKHLQAKLARLRRYQRSYSRQRDAALVRMGLDPKKRIPKGTRIEVSNRMRTKRHQIGVLHARIADARRDHQHQLTARVVASANVIALEDLAIKAMSRSMGRRTFRRSVGDAGLGEIRRQLTYKAQWRGRTLSVIDRWYPSSKTCSGCGSVNKDLKLRERHWTCPTCGASHDRDLNAAINIEREGIRLLAEHTGPDGRTPRSGEPAARGGDACAAVSSSATGQPASANRELTYRVALPRTTRRHRNGSAARVEW